MKKEKIFNLIKIIIPGIIFSIGVIYLIAWGPTSPAPDGNASRPINIGSSNQVKGTEGVPNYSLFDLKGFLSVDESLAVSGDAVFDGGLIVSGLTPNGSETKLCATNDGTIVYCDPAPTVPKPEVSTTIATGIGLTYATSGGDVTSVGGGSVSARGVAWSLSANPTVDLTTKTVDGVGGGVFTSSITGLNNNTTYHYRAYATNEGGTSYGNDLTFTTAMFTYSLSVNKPSGTTVVTSFPAGINCGGTNNQCQDNFAPGTMTLTVSPTPPASSQWVWTGCTKISPTECSLDLSSNKTVSVSLSVCTGYLSSNGYCWYKQTNLNGESCNTFCSSIGKACKPNTQNGTMDDVVLSNFGYSPSGCSYTFGNSSAVMQVNSGSGCYSRKTSGGVPETLTFSCSNTRSWWGHICSCE